MNVKRVNDANATASGIISNETINRHIEMLANKYAKSMKIDGFRRGKVPVNIIKSRYKDNLNQESRKKSIDEFYENAIKELQLETKDLVGQPLVSIKDNDNGIEIELKIGVIPKFDIENIQSCIPTFSLKEATEQDIENRLKELAYNRSPVIESEAKELKEGHIANIDFKGFIDDKAFDGGSGYAFDLTIGSQQFIPGFEESLIGMKLGEEKSIDVSFPEDYQSKELAGKLAKFNVKLNAIKQKNIIEIDDNFAKIVLGDKDENNLEALKKQIRKDLEMEGKLKLYNEKLKEEVLMNISEKFTFDLPENILEQEMNVLFNNEISIMKQEELESLKKNTSKSKELYEAQRDKATTSVRVTFVIDKFAKEKKITVNDNEVFQAIYYESIMNRQNPQELIEHYKKSNLLPAVKMAMIEDKVITYLLDNNLNAK